MNVKIIGLGPGGADYILPKAVKEMESSHVLLGFSRAIGSLDHIHIPKKTVSSLKEILEYINDNPKKEVGIVASGDPAFYGILNYIKHHVKAPVRVIPGLSSFQYLMAKLQKSWQDAYVGSLHGRDADFETITRDYQVSIWLTDKVQNPSYICGELLKQKQDYWVYVGENLSYPDEKITQGRPEELEVKSWSDLSIVVVEQKVRGNNETH